MIALQGEYDNGIITLANKAPINKAKVIVIFPDTEKEIKNKLYTDESRVIFDRYTGCVERLLDEKIDKLEALDEKHEGIS